MIDRAAMHLERLVGFNTVSHLSNAELIHYAADHLREFGVEAALFPDPSGGKLGMHATIGPMVEGGVVLSGHSDVVPVEGQNWTSDPFKLTERDGRLYGRGAVDMKGFLAACLAMAPEMSRANLKRPIHLVMSYDEETTCRGVLPVIDDMVRRLPRIGAVIVGEPTSMQLVTAHKGAYGYKVTVTGKPAHSSLADQGVSAVAIASRLVVWLDDRLRRNRTGAADGRFQPNYTTCHAGTIQGGTACNILAGECSFEWDLRNLPDDDPEAFLREFLSHSDELVAEANRMVGGCGLRWEEDYAVPGLRPEEDGAAEALCRRLTGANDVATVSFSSEAGFFQSAGLSTVLLGPGSIEQAHIADEFIEISQLAACGDFLDRLIQAQAA
ncbi:MAG TPA: acetylornithine deacetylase [Mesorhizobium sp.]|jgi:acetylornithine deacetylase|nr:acetylornithine deacetylase [Mesorhizobium sp.]